MSKYHYLIALALIEQNNVRAMPLGGKSLKSSLGGSDPGKTGEDLAKELLIRVFQRSEKGTLKILVSEIFLFS